MKTKILKTVQIIFGINIASIYLFFTKGPRIAARSARIAFYGVLRTESNALKSIPIVKINDLIGQKEPCVTITIKSLDEGMLPINQLLVLLAIIVTENPQEVLEIGTYMGNTTKLIAENLPSCLIHTVDLPLETNGQNEIIPKDDFHLINKRIVGRDYKGLTCERRIHQLLVDTAEWDFKEAANASFFFIDGSHTYEYVKNDSEKCLSVCRKDAVFVWHDCDDDHPGVIKFINEWILLGRSIVRIGGTPFAYWKYLKSES